MSAVGRTRIYPYDPATMHSRGRPAAAETPIEAVMMAAPFAEPEESSLEKQVRFETLRDALEGDVLTDRERWLVEATYWRGLAVRQVAAELGLSKTHAHRLMKQALAKLAVHLVGPGGPPVTSPAPVLNGRDMRTLDA